ncbi:Putative copper efflux transporter, RND family, MFP subunit CusB [Acidithiobacillus ferrivorans]|uniref:Copper efflux transporter, RND family, MFP subunit CusB n=1 Tax=Acidithiobacillus ferrivorans TaxID=160808 RepID=A0A060UQX3_9PROT|nr:MULTISPECIES: efflux RND transporter periplasmic adaptor subunit [Acidithiobacillus]MBU2833927.1 efflux RND transporter periplasmic adaptor subunit [Acidithiobacillus ferriphilus]UEP58340.1 efflux RND transporter periplasmic adaptor subunit [Acidithiobacillus ferriphilus]CDQ08949.1 putative Heavy metal RND efflux membrane fusion protein, CzcB family (cusB or silB) [Acidithiobacillus ferrivorans]SMH66703.1 Putative copper efflux transporter, RND family, MFP subunit CusB [Acidithiobacillus fer
MKSRNWIIGMGLLVLGVALGAGVVWWLRAAPDAAPSANVAATHPQESTPKGRHILYWAAPMDPKIHSDHPMKDSMGMAYIPVYASSPNAKKESGLSIDPRLAQNLGVRLVAVQRRQMGHAIHTVGTVAVDENRVYSVTPRFSGWVTRLHVRAVGDPVQRGQVLAEIYSPELYSAQQEYLIARRQGGTTEDPALLAAAKARLRLLGMPENQIAALARHGTAERDVPLMAPASGVVETLNVRQGSYVSPQTNLYEIANLDRIWVNVALYSYQLPWVHIGDAVRLHLPAYPGKSWEGRLNFLYPTLDPKNRTVTARLSFPNPGGMLRPGTYSDATVLASAAETLAVPSSAVLRTTQGDYVMLGEGQGHFLPVQVALGPEADGWVAIDKGLKAGDRVVESAQFLLYSESQFQSVKARMLGGTTSAAPGTGISQPQNMTQGRKPPASAAPAGNAGAPPTPPASSGPGVMVGMNRGQGGKSHD